MEKKKARNLWKKDFYLAHGIWKVMNHFQWYNCSTEKWMKTKSFVVHVPNELLYYFQLLMQIMPFFFFYLMKCTWTFFPKVVFGFTHEPTLAVSCFSLFFCNKKCLNQTEFNQPHPKSHLLFGYELFFKIKSVPRG